MMRPATGTLRRPLRGSKTRGGTISQEAARRLAIASRITTGAGSSRDGQRNSARPSLGNQSDQVKSQSWDFDEDEQDFGEKKNPPKPHASP
jgi:hypothetical protein